MTGLFGETLLPWVIETGIAAGKAGGKIFLVLGLGWLTIRFLKSGLTQVEVGMARAGLAAGTDAEATKQRAATLTGILRTILLTLVWSVIIIELLEQVGLDIRPILAGAGILGLAVGFGAQNIVRDLISGFFVILEDQIRLGDVAIINGTSGQVEGITFRTITLRDFSGVVHTFPSGTITTLSNMTKGWSAFVLDMGVAYKEDIDRVAELMRQVGEDLQAEPAFANKFVAPIEIVGVDNFADSAVTLRIRIKTRPLEQWIVGREYRRRVKIAFDAAGIEIPFPHQTLYMGEASRPFEVQVQPGLSLSKG